MASKIVKLVAALLVLNAVYQIVPPLWRYQRFKEAIQDLALQAREQPDATIIADVMDLAAEHHVPLERDWIAVRRSRDLSHTYIDASWVQELAVVPGWTYTWIAEVKVDGRIKPPTLKDFR